MKKKEKKEKLHRFLTFSARRVAAERDASIATIEEQLLAIQLSLPARRSAAHLWSRLCLSHLLQQRSLERLDRLLGCSTSYSFVLNTKRKDGKRLEGARCSVPERTKIVNISSEGVTKV
jgi:hypothetical protein